MMKFAALFVLAVLGTANACSLEEDFQDLMNLVPFNEIKSLTLEYANNDAEFQQVLAYLRSEDFHAILAAIHATPEWNEFVAYFDESGLAIYNLIEVIERLLDFSSYDLEVPSTSDFERSFHSWLGQVLALIPTDEIAARLLEKLQTSACVQGLWSRLRSEDFRAIVDAVIAVEEWQALMDKGRDHGAPVDSWVNILRSIWGW